MNFDSLKNRTIFALPNEETNRVDTLKKESHDSYKSRYEIRRQR